MAAEQASKEGRGERLSRHLRNLHVLGAVALVGAGVLVPPLAPVAFPVAEFATAEAGAFEVVHHLSKKRRTRKQK